MIGVFFSALEKTWRHLAKKRDGQVALTFGLALLPLTLSIGCGVDVSRAIAAKSRLLEALDATGLAVARSTSSDPRALNTMAHAYFYANFASANLGTVDSMSVESLSGNKGIRISATARMPTYFMALAGYKEVEVGATSEVVREARALDLVMVLDTTASMAGTKISTLKTAARSLVDMVLVNETVSIGLVPFERYVNIGTANRSIPGVSVPPDTKVCTPSTKTVTSCTGSETYQSTCTRQINPRPSTCMVDGSPMPCTVYDTQSYPCTKTRSTGCTSTQVPSTTCQTTTFFGCVGSRKPPLNASDESFSSPLVGLMNITCGTPLTKLTGSVTTLRNAVSALTASGNTYIPAGLQIGWHVLTPRIPFTEGKAYTADPPPRRVMLLMTDGTNSASLGNWNSSSTVVQHTGSNRVAADQLTLDLCTKIKSDGIEIYSVAFEITDAATKDMIRQCASTSDNFFDADSQGRLLEAFAAIAVGLSNLRVSN